MYEENKMWLENKGTDRLTNQNSLFRSRDWLSVNQGPVFPDSVVSWTKKTLMPPGVSLSQYLPQPDPPCSSQEPSDTSKQPIRTRYLGDVTGYQGSVAVFPDSVGSCIRRYSFKVFDRTHIPSCSEEGFCKPLTRRTEFTRFKKIITLFLKLLGIFHVLGYISCYQIQVFNGFERVDKCGLMPPGVSLSQYLPQPDPPCSSQEPSDTSKQPIRTRYLGDVTGYQGSVAVFPDSVGSCIRRYSFKVFDRTHIPSCSEEGFCKPLTRRTEFTRFKKIITLFLKLLGIFHVLGYISCYQI
eukprot:sb/3467435/